MDEEEEIFEISDFTVVTDWERFVVRLESILYEWQLTGANRRPKHTLPKGALQFCQWKEKQETLSFSALNLRVTLYELQTENVTSSAKSTVTPNFSQSHVPPIMADLMDAGSDFCPGYVSKYYGLSQFILLSPASKSDVVLQEDKRNMVISAILLATSSSECDTPILLQFGETWRQLYSGICQNRNVRTDFDMAHLAQCPAKYTNLTGLLEMFRDKVATPMTAPPSVKVSVRLTYELQEKFDSRWPQALPDFEQEGLAALTPVNIDGNVHFAFGICQDPLKSIRLSVTWPNLNEDMIVENDVYTDLDPLNAPYWSVCVAFERGLQCLLHDSLLSLLNATRCQTSIDSVLGVQEPTMAGSALNKLTETPVSRALPMISGATFDTNNSDLPLDAATVERLLDVVFAVQQTNNNWTVAPETPESKAPDFGGPGKAVKGRNPSPVRSPSISEKGDLFQATLDSCKTAPLKSVCIRLAGCLCELLNGPTGLPAVCQLWREFVVRLRVFFEAAELLPDMAESATPDLGSCLLHQKLCMLQCCICAKLKRMKWSDIDDTQSSEDENDFYDCYEDTTESEVDANESLVGVGRMAPAADMMLTMDKTQTLYVPITQDPSPMTEDMVEEHLNSLDSIGSGSEAAAIRAKLQTQSLVSDMQAFKAANPGCVMEDFVRWHSPRDWTDDGSERGKFSSRMSTPGNLWQETWNSAEKIPVSRQKRLFNETKEAEKILTWMGSLSVSEVATLLLPALFTAAITQLCNEAADVSELIGEKMQSAARKLLSATKHAHVDEYRDLLHDVHWIEASTAQYRSLRSRFVPESNKDKRRWPSETDVKAFVLSLMRSETEVPIFGAANSELGIALRRLFVSDDRVAESNEQSNTRARFPSPLFKEYVMRWCVPRPAAQSRATPHRMYARVHPGQEFRCAGAFSEDLTLF